MIEDSNYPIGPIDDGTVRPAKCDAARVEQLEAELDKHRWIPVSERLPKDEYSILAYGNDGFGYKIVANTSYNLEFKKFRILSKVTHWKPIILPEGE